MDGILIIILTLVLSAFFSGMEIAFVASNKLRIELDRKQGTFGSRFIKVFADNPGQYIATMLIGNNSSCRYGLFISRLLSPVLTPIFSSDLLVLILNTIISTGVILLVAEFLPKTVFIISPNFFLKLLSLPTIFFFYVFYPVSKFTLAASNFIIGIFFGLKINKKEQANLVFSKVDLDNFVNFSKQTNDEAAPYHHNIRIFQNALDFSNVKLRECMVPRTEIDAVESKICCRTKTGLLKPVTPGYLFTRAL
jgi:CBS domain containing-hemolysin-like protein